MQLQFVTLLLLVLRQPQKLRVFLMKVENMGLGMECMLVRFVVEFPSQYFMFFTHLKKIGNEALSHP